MVFVQYRRVFGVSHVLSNNDGSLPHLGRLDETFGLVPVIDCVLGLPPTLRVDPGTYSSGFDVTTPNRDVRQLAPAPTAG